MDLETTMVSQSEKQRQTPHDLNSYVQSIKQNKQNENSLRYRELVMVRRERREGREGGQNR